MYVPGKSGPTLFLRPPSLPFCFYQEYTIPPGLTRSRLVFAFDQNRILHRLLELSPFPFANQVPALQA